MLSPAGNDLRQYINETVARGTSLFNAGRARECAEAYFECARFCVSSGGLPADCSMVLQQAMQRATGYFRQAGGSAVEGCAWQLRSALDYTLSALAHTQVALPSQMPYGNFVDGGTAGGFTGYGGSIGTAGDYYRASAMPLNRPMAPAYYPGGYAEGWEVQRPSPTVRRSCDYQVQAGRRPSAYYQDATTLKPYSYESSQADSGWGSAALGAVGGLAAGALLGEAMCGHGGALTPALAGGALGAAAGSYTRGNANGALVGGLGGAAAGLMLTGADSPAEALAIGSGMVGGAALGGSNYGLGGAALGGLAGGAVGDLLVDSGPGDCLAM